MKNNTSPVEFLDLSELDRVSAHLALGNEVKRAAHRRLKLTLDGLDGKGLSEQVSRVQTVRKMLEDRSKRTDFVGRAIESYLVCCSAWAEGTDLAKFQHPKLVDIRDVSPIDLALLLQLEPTGCQTGVFRQEDGSIILWHTEEDVDENTERFDKLRIVAIKSGEEIAHAFIYPDLLPGPAFSWTERGTALAVDSILAKANSPTGSFSNLIYWIVLFYHESLAPQAILAGLAPIMDGGAITTLSSGEEIRAERTEFVADDVMISRLDPRPGSYLFQSNVFSQKNSNMSRSFESIEPAKRRIFEAREIRTARAIKKLESKSLPDFYHMMTSRRGGEWAYANQDVKSHFLFKASRREFEVWVGAGSAKPNVLPTTYRHILGAEAD